MDQTPNQIKNVKIKRVVKYFIMGWIVAVACLAIPTQRLAMVDVFMISMVAAIGYSVVDNYMVDNYS
jgi:TctA family transporter